MNFCGESCVSGYLSLERPAVTGVVTFNEVIRSDFFCLGKHREIMLFYIQFIVFVVLPVNSNVSAKWPQGRGERSPAAFRWAWLQ
jgi:hypothetical protein